VYIYSVHTNLSQLLNVLSRLSCCQVKSSRVCSSRPPSTWGHFSLKSGHVFVPQWLADLTHGLPPDVSRLTARAWSRGDSHAH